MLLVALFACGSDGPLDSGHHGKRPSADSGGTDSADTADTSPTGDSAPADSDSGGTGSVDPPLGGTSGGHGGSDHTKSTTVTVSGTSYLLLAPSGSSSGTHRSLLVVISGTEGAITMMSNMSQVAPYYGLDETLIVVLDGTSQDETDAATAMDDVRADYDVDNDQTWLLSESAGTHAGLKLGFHTRQSWFAAYWANDVNDRDTPAETSAQLGFTPSGNAGPGGDAPDAEAIVDGMRTAGYDLPSDAPYSGAGSTEHGSTQQFLAAVSFFAGKRRE